MYHLLSVVSTSLDETVQMSRQVSLSELQGRLSDRFIMTLASSPDNQPVVKMFLFAQHVSVCRHVRLILEQCILNSILLFRCLL